MADPRTARRSTRLLGSLLLLTTWAPACGVGRSPDATLAFGDGGAHAVLEQAVNQGGPNPAPLTVLLSNHGTCVLDYELTFYTVDGASWLDVTPTSGSLAPSPSGGDTLTVSLDVVGPPQLAPGTFTGTITLTGTCQTNGLPALGSPLTISVNLTVTPVVAGISADPDRLTQDVVSLDDAWSSINPDGPAPRIGHAQVWTGSELVVWGGTSSLSSGYLFPDGGLYEPVTDTWTLMDTQDAPTGRFFPAVAWTGSEMIVWGGGDNAGTLLDDGGRYDPLANAWTPIASEIGFPGRIYTATVWTGSLMIVWGGNTPIGLTNTGAAFDPSDGSWAGISTVGAPEAREYPAAVWTGRQMIVWGGLDATAHTLDTGAMYDPVAHQWTAMSSFGAPADRMGCAAVWTGKEMIVWGGWGASGILNPPDYRDDGARFDPETNTWRPMDAGPDAPFLDSGTWPAFVWTGSRMLVWGGNGSGLPLGGAYDPGTDTWSPMSTVSAPPNLLYLSALWTGREMLVWGGYDGSLSELPRGGGLYH